MKRKIFCALLVLMIALSACSSGAEQNTASGTTVEPTEDGQRTGAYTPQNNTGTLSLSDLTYDYVEFQSGDGMIWDETTEQFIMYAVGKINLYFTVNGPSEVRDVQLAMIATENHFSQEQIEQDIAEAISYLSEEGFVPGEKTPPFYGYSSFDVYQWETTTRDVLLIGLGEDMTAVGYAVVTVDIP